MFSDLLIQNSKCIHIIHTYVITTSFKETAIGFDIETEIYGLGFESISIVAGLSMDNSITKNNEKMSFNTEINIKNNVNKKLKQKN